MSKRLHILVLTSWYPNEKEPFLGNFVHEFAKALSKRHDVTLLYSDFSTKDKYGMVKEIHNPHFNVCRAYIPSRKGIFHKYVASKMGIDFIEKNFPKVDIIHAQIGIRDWYHFLWTRKRLQRPMIYTEHGSYFIENQFNKLSRFKQNGLKRLFKFTYENTAVSAFLADNIRKQTKKKVHVIGNFIPNEWFTIPLKGEPDSTYRFLHVSGMDQNKNPKGILEACKILASKGKTNWKITFVSESDTGEFEKWIEQNNLKDHIFFQKAVPHQEMPNIYVEHDCFILNSFQETFSIVNAEALCFGLHLITTEVGFLIGNKAAYIDKIPFDSPQSLANKMEESIIKRKSSGMLGCVFSEQFKEDTILDLYDKIYQKVL